MKLKSTDLDQNLEVPDIPTMYEMSEKEYREYIQNEGIFWLDHHEVLREKTTARPIATTLEQLEILLEELKKQRRMMQPKNK